MFSFSLSDFLLNHHLGSDAFQALYQVVTNCGEEEVDSSRTRTTSLTAKFLLALFHFCLSCRADRYSRIQRRQNTSARYCTRHHCRREKLSSLTNVPSSNLGPDHRISRWLGVRASGSLGSSETLVNRRPLMMDSTSHSKVSSPSSSSGWSFRSAFITLRVVRICLSQKPL